MTVRRTDVLLKPAYGYLRRSKEDDGNSLAAQKAAILAKFEPLGFRIVEWFVDEHSAFRDSAGRDGIQQLFEALDNRPDIRDVCIEQADRLGRDTDHVGWIRFELTQRKVRLHYVLNDYDLSTPDGIMMHQVSTGMAAAHSMQNSQKTHSRMMNNFIQRDPNSGWVLKNGGRSQYGYKIEHVKLAYGTHSKNRSIWIIDEFTSKVFRRIVVDMRIARSMSFVEIRDKLNAEGIPIPEGGLWTKSTIHEILRPDRLKCATGVAIWNRENKKDPLLRHDEGKFKPENEWVIIDGAHPAILTPEECEAAIAVGRRRGPRTFTPRTDSSPYLFSGPNTEGETMFICKRCGGPMTSYQKSKDRATTLAVTLTIKVPMAYAVRL